MALWYIHVEMCTNPNPNPNPNPSPSPSPGPNSNPNMPTCAPIGLEKSRKEAGSARLSVALS